MSEMTVDKLSGALDDIIELVKSIYDLCASEGTNPDPYAKDIIKKYELKITEKRNADYGYIENTYVSR